MAEPWPAVSVVVATRDRPELLRRAVGAILAQDYPGPIECLVVYDQSQPGLQAGATPPGRSLRVLTNQRTPGLAGARNTGAIAAAGELLAFCDDDDEWLAGKLARQVACLLGGPDAVVCSGIWVHHRGRVTRRVTSAGAITHRDLLRSRVMELHPSTVLVRRASFFGRIGLVDEAIPGGYGEDYDWLLRAARVAPIRTLREPLVRVHWHSSSFFAERWRMIADAIAYLLRKHPEFATERAGLALMYGKLAFATAGAGERRQALRLALRCLAVRRGERRAWLAIAVGLRLVSARAVMRALNHLGRGL